MILFIISITISCSDKKKNTEQPLKHPHEVTFLEHSFCTGKFASGELETIHLKAIGDNALLFDHDNVVFTCGLDRIISRIDQSQHDTVNITEVSIGVPTDCVCPYNVDMKISEFIQGNKYHFIINKTFERFSPESHYEFDIEYRNDLDTIFVVGEINLKK